ncbi:septum formation inhibitor Maf [Achromatium sp. WMS1]|nr:septum formation inhibitor Maf [Achromatium sp. WMS1]
MNSIIHGHKLLVLASTSISRRNLLQRLRIEFTMIAPDVDETAYPDEAPIALVKRLAEAKAKAGVQQVKGDALIIGSDQVACLDHVIIGKPGSRDAAIAQLEQASGRSVLFYTGLCVLDSASGNLQTTCVPCKVYFRSLHRHTIENYVDLEPVLNCAGSFKSEGLGIALFERIDGDDPTALIGLPLISLVSMLEHFGVSLFAMKNR